MSQKIFGRLFLSIGAMKAGTTWLYAVLARHPELHFSLEKEVHYFNHRYINPEQLNQLARNTNAHSRYLRFHPEKVNPDHLKRQLLWTAKYISNPVDDQWYAALFERTDDKHWACDFSNLHAQVPAHGWQEISEKCDQLRVLYTMRHPLKRLWSHTKFHLQVSGELEKLDTWTLDDFNAFVRQPFIWDNAEYGAVLRRMRKGLITSERLALFYEDIHADQLGALRQIEEFLDVAPGTYPESALAQRPTRSVERPMPAFFADLFADDIARITSEIEDEGYTIPDAWRS